MSPACGSSEDPISDQAYVAALIRVYRKSQVFTFALQDWDLKPKAEHTVDNLHKHFLAADKARCKNNALTMKGALGANAATGTDTTTDATSKDTAVPHYCWTHGLMCSLHSGNHNGTTCSNPAKGHIKTATWNNMQGGNDRIYRLKGEKAVFVPRKPALSEQEKKAERIKRFDARVAKAAQELINKENSQTGANQ